MNIQGILDNSVSFLIGGEAGQGINRSGGILGKTILRGGYYIYGRIDYPSVIRGSHNFYVLRVSDEEVYSNYETIDLILALNKETVTLHVDELNQNGGIIYDEDVELEGDLGRDDLSLYPVPLSSIVEEIEGREVIRNTVALGAAIALIDYDLDILKQVISDSFRGREEIIELNNTATERGFNYVKDNFSGEFPCLIKATEGKSERLMITGNESVGLGAINAGCRFYAAYPMTPASPLLHFLAQNDVKNDMIVIQPESEIAAINMVVGASYAGLRSMTATSGGGFCLMSEGLGFAAMTESPVVIMLAQRPGPSTGLPTYTSQGDLLFSISASQGEFPRVVVAPGDVEECFYLTQRAFNLAEKFQIPSIIITDKNLAENHKSTDTFEIDRIPIDRGRLLDIKKWDGEDEYNRYEFTDDGVSPRAIPGTKGLTVFANSNEHVEYGYTTSEPEASAAMTDKRLRKMKKFKEEISGLKPIKTYGSSDPDITFFGWGSVKGAAREAIKLLDREEVKSRFVQIVFLEPFPEEAVEECLEGNDVKMIIENNATGQLEELIRKNNQYQFNNILLKYDGRPFYPSEIKKKVMEVL